MMVSPQPQTNTSQTNAALYLQAVAMRGLLVVLLVPTVSSLIWRLPGPTRSSPIMDITSRLFQMGQTMARLVGSLSGNYPYPAPHYQHQHYQHYQDHNTGKPTLYQQ